MEVVIFGAYIVFGIYLFHKIFDVYYFDLGNGLLRELMGGFIFAGVCIWLWWLADIALAILGFASYRTGKKGLSYVCIFFIILTTILGILTRVA